MYRKILILSNGLPGYSDGGGVLLLNQILDYGPQNFCLFSSEKIPNHSRPDILDNMPIKLSPLRIFRGLKYYNIIKKIPLLEEIIYLFLLVKRRKEVVRFAKKHKVECVYAIFRGDTLPLVNYLVRKLKLNLIGYIPDTIEAEWNDKKIIYNIKKNHYYKAIAKSKYLAVAGKSMADYYKKKFNKKSVIFHIGVDWKLKDNENSFYQNIIKIGFVGSLYAKKEYKKFSEALNQLSNQYPKYKISFISIGKFKPDSINNIDIEYLGWLNQDELLKRMEDVDIGYLPYKFDENYKTQMSLAFPTKIVNYLATQTPVFFHGPAYSSVNNFIKKYPCGVSCGSMNEDDIVAKLEKLVFDKEFYNRCKNACELAYKNEFTKEKMTENFKYFINKGLENKDV